MRLLLRLVLNTLAVAVSAYILPGVMVSDWLAALIAAIVLGVANAFIRPLLVLLTLPVTILTLGLFIFVINALIVMLVDYLVPGFEVAGFWWALLFSFVVSLVSWFLYAVASED